MKRLALVAAVLFIAACAAKEEVPVVDSAAMAPAVAPAPAPMDSAMRMDSIMKAESDTTKKM